jgi:DNA-directed RNA polymerase subunit RPC12/RpoP
MKWFSMKKDGYSCFSKKEEKEFDYVCTVCKTKFTDKRKKDKIIRGCVYTSYHHYTRFWNDTREKVIHVYFCEDCSKKNRELWLINSIYGDDGNFECALKPEISKKYHENYLMQVMYKEGWDNIENILTYPLLKEIQNKDIDFEGYVDSKNPLLQLYIHNQVSNVMLQYAKVVKRERKINLDI